MKLHNLINLDRGIWKFVHQDDDDDDGDGDGDDILESIGVSHTSHRSLMSLL